MTLLAGARKVATIKDCIDTFDPTAAKTVEKAQLGEFDIGILAHQLMLTLAKRGAPLKYADPKEGAILQFSTAAVTKNAPNPKMAQALLNELLSERVQVQLVEAFNAGPVNTAVKVPDDALRRGRARSDAHDRQELRGDPDRRDPEEPPPVHPGGRSASWDSDGEWSPTICRCAGITKTYAGLAVVSDVSLAIRKGEILTILGPLGLRQDHDAQDRCGLRRSRTPARSWSRSARSIICRATIAAPRWCFRATRSFPI